MNLLNFMQTLSALCGISIIAFGTLWLKQYLKSRFCF
jgi:hypothetical protein